MSSEFPPIIAIVGPTAVGKTSLALQLANAFRAEIISADSRQAYRYMDIGTAKPTLMERQNVPHHMIDLVPPDDVYSVQRYQKEASEVLRYVAARGRIALVVGGTGFYIRALLDGMTLPEVAPDPALRALLRAEADSLGPTVLHARLRARDPRSALRIHPNNLPRVIRALEIIDRLGGPVPESALRDGIPALYIGLRRTRENLREIADLRVIDQVASGLVEETRRLLAMGFSAELPALQGFAYRQMIAYLRGEMTLSRAISSYQTATHQYIRRQMTWFRADARIRWLDVDKELVGKARRMIAEWLSTVS